MKGSVLRFGSRILWGRLTGKLYPFLVQFSVTNRCNARCSYCYASYYDRPRDDLSLEQVQTVIDNLARAGTFRLNLVGGEPLIREDIGAIIDHARRRGLHCALTTNGSLVRRKLEAVRKLDTLCFSIDGRPEGNDLNRGPGSFERAIAGMEAAGEAGVPLQLSAVLTKHTVRDVDFMVELARKYGCRVGFTPLIRQRGDDAGHEGALLPTNEEVRAALGRIVDLKRTGAPVLFSAAAYRYALHWPDLTRDLIHGEDPGFPSVRCFAGSFFCIVDYNGDLYPCPQLVDLFKPGNVLRDGLLPALERASRHGCRACSMPCSNEFSMFFGLKPAVLLDQLRGWRG